MLIGKKVGTILVFLISVEPKSILVAGGYAKYPPLDSVEIISSESSLTNKKLAELPNGIDGQPSLFLQDGNLLLCGGQGNENYCLMHEQNSWNEHSKLNNMRSFASAVTTADGTFIFGGDDSKETFEFLPKNSNVWNQGRSKIPKGFRHGCAVEVPEKEEILLIGGYDTHTRILKFDIKTKGFEEMHNSRGRVALLKERHFHTCARLPGTSLFVITGGRDSDFNKQDTTEILNVYGNIISLGNSMNTKRIGHGMAMITIDNEDRLAVFGGQDENWDYLESVETLNPKTRKWEVSDLKLKQAKGYFGYTSVPNNFLSKI